MLKFMKYSYVMEAQLNEMCKRSRRNTPKIKKNVNIDRVIICRIFC